MADSKLADLTADTAPTGDDLIYAVNDPGGTPADRKVTLTNLAASVPFSGLYLTYVEHGSTAGTARPSTSGPVIWFGSVTPTNIEVGDIVVNPDENPIGARVTKRKSSAETAANNTLQDDDTLNFSIGANEIWVATFHLYTSCAVDTADIKTAITAPASATISIGVIGPASTLTSTEGDGHFQSHTTAAPQSGVPASANADGYTIVSASVANSSTAGTVQLQWAQQNTSAGNPVSVKAGSFMVADRVA